MSKREVVKSYIKALEDNSYNDVVKCFAQNARVHSPLYGKIDYAKYFQLVLEDFTKSKITLKNIFVSDENSELVAAHVEYAGTLKDGTKVQYEGIYLFEFEPDSEKIKTLSFIYAYHDLKQSVENLKTVSRK